MDINDLKELLLSSPAALFGLGVLAGFILRGLTTSMAMGKSGKKKSSRYKSQPSRRAEPVAKEVGKVVDIKDSPLGWSDNVVKNLAERNSRYHQAIGSQPAKPVQQVTES